MLKVFKCNDGKCLYIHSLHYELLWRTICSKYSNAAWIFSTELKMEYFHLEVLARSAYCLGHYTFWKVAEFRCYWDRVTKPKVSLALTLPYHTTATVKSILISVKWLSTSKAGFRCISPHGNFSKPNMWFLLDSAPERRQRCIAKHQSQRTTIYLSGMEREGRHNCRLRKGWQRAFSDSALTPAQIPCENPVESIWKYNTAAASSGRGNNSASFDNQATIYAIPESVQLMLSLCQNLIQNLQTAGASGVVHHFFRWMMVMTWSAQNAFSWCQALKYDFQCLTK